MVTEYTIIDDGVDIATIIDGELIEVRNRITNVLKKITPELKRKYGVTNVIIDKSIEVVR